MLNCFCVSVSKNSNQNQKSPRIKPYTRAPFLLLLWLALLTTQASGGTLDFLTCITVWSRIIFSQRQVAAFCGLFWSKMRRTLAWILLRSLELVNLPYWVPFLLYLLLFGPLICVSWAKWVKNGVHMGNRTEIVDWYNRTCFLQFQQPW